MKRLAHALLLVLGFCMWAIGTGFFTLAMWIAVAGSKVMPGTMGNCWNHALPKYRKGGYLLIRPADDVRFLGRFPIPHVMWADRLPDGMPLEQYVPLVRSNSKWLPWRTIWYEGRIRHRERRRRGDPQPETSHAPLDWF